MATPNYDINYDDERLTQVESDKQVVLSEMENTYDGMINQSDSFYQSQIEASKQWAYKQAQLQQENTNFAIEQIEQQKDKANKDYLKEQSGAYADWQKQSNKFGANAEQMASSGMANTGFSESSQVSMYNTYQNRVATARESYNQAILNYNNGIKEAQLQNNSKLAEIAYTALQQQLELSIQGFQYKNQLIAEQTNKKLEVDNMYHNRYQDVLNQINQENALAEEVRQYNENLLEEQRQFNEQIAYKKEQDALAQENWLKEYELQQGKPSDQQDDKENLLEIVYKGANEAFNYDRGLTLGQATGNSTNAPTFNTYEDAAAYLQSKGISGDGGLMTKSEWARRKASGRSTAETAYASYKEYLEAFVEWKLSNAD